MSDVDVTALLPIAAAAGEATDLREAFRCVCLRRGLAIATDQKVLATRRVEDGFEGVIDYERDLLLPAAAVQWVCQPAWSTMIREVTNPTGNRREAHMELVINAGGTICSGEIAILETLSKFPAPERAAEVIGEPRPPAGYVGFESRVLRRLLAVMEAFEREAGTSTLVLELRGESEPIMWTMVPHGAPDNHGLDLIGIAMPVPLMEVRGMDGERPNLQDVLRWRLLRGVEERTAAEPGAEG